MGSLVVLGVALLALKEWAPPVTGAPTVSMCNDTRFTCPPGFRLVCTSANADCLFIDGATHRREVNRLCYGRQTCSLQVSRMVRPEVCGSRRCLHVLMPCVEVQSLQTHGIESAAWWGFLHSPNYPDHVNMTSSESTLTPRLANITDLTVDVYDMLIFPQDILWLCPIAEPSAGLVCRALQMYGPREISMKTGVGGVKVLAHMKPSGLGERRFMFRYKFTVNTEYGHLYVPDIKYPVTEIIENTTQGGAGRWPPEMNDVTSASVSNTSSIATESPASVYNRTQQDKSSMTDNNTASVTSFIEKFTNITTSTTTGDNALPTTNTSPDRKITQPNDTATVEVKQDKDATTTPRTSTDDSVRGQNKPSNAVIYVILGGVGGIFLILLVMGLALGLLLRRRKRRPHKRRAHQSKLQTRQLPTQDEQPKVKKSRKAKGFDTVKSWSWASWGRI